MQSLAVTTSSLLGKQVFESQVGEDELNKTFSENSPDSRLSSVTVRLHRADGGVPKESNPQTFLLRAPTADFLQHQDDVSGVKAMLKPSCNVWKFWKVMEKSWSSTEKWTHSVYSAETPSLNCSIHAKEDGWNKVFTFEKNVSVASTNTLISIKAYK